MLLFFIVVIFGLFVVNVDFVVVVFLLLYSLFVFVVVDVFVVVVSSLLLLDSFGWFRVVMDQPCCSMYCVLVPYLLHCCTLPSLSL